MARKRNDITVSSGVTPPPRRTVQRRVRHLASAADVTFESQPAEIVSAYEPGYEEIAQLAYSYWEARGCQGGCPEEDWLQAERELRSRVKSAAV